MSQKKQKSLPIKKKRAGQAGSRLPGKGKEILKNAAPYAAAVIFFLAACLNYNFFENRMRVLVLIVSFITLAAAALRFKKLRRCLSLPVIALTLYVIVDGVSALYAAGFSSGALSLYAFLICLDAYCVALTFTALAPGDRREAGKWLATVMAGAAGLIGFFSIDLISTRFFSTPVLEFLSRFTPDYTGLPGIEAGVRITSIFNSSNVFAGLMGIGVLLALGALSDEKPGWRRCVLLVILYINSLAFLLSFSMGATGMIAAAFLVYLLLERGVSRSAALVLMLETLLLTMISAMVISMTSFTDWTGIRTLPLLCTAAGAAGLCLLDRFVGHRVTDLMARAKKLVTVVTLSAAAVLVVYAAAAVSWTGGVELSAGEGLRRAAYPDPGEYSLSVRADGQVNVTVESQNRQETMMHTSTVLYTGPADGASFTVPGDSLVVYFDLSVPAGTTVEALEYNGPAGSGSLPLGYRLLPGFIANRLQGLLANENAIQRTVFFSDGMKLFKERPFFGWGLSGFENFFRRAQSFYYSTRFVHNHYIEVMVDKGVVGIAVFLLLLLSCAAALWFELRRKEERSPLAPALAAALVYMAGHAGVEVVFSTHQYLPFAFGTVALIGVCCGDAVPVPVSREKLRNTVRTAAAGVSMLFILIFAALIYSNLHATHIVEEKHTLSVLDSAIASDPFEWSDYALSYVSSVGAQAQSVSPTESARADKYAARLEKSESYVASYTLARYYFMTDRPEKALFMTEKLVRQTASDESWWQNAFDLMEQFYDGSELLRNGILHIWDLMEEWNADNMGQVTPSQETADFVSGLR